jgi:hypothetical protein
MGNSLKGAKLQRSDQILDKRQVTLFSSMLPPSVTILS